MYLPRFLFLGAALGALAAAAPASETLGGGEGEVVARAINKETGYLPSAHAQRVDREAAAKKGQQDKEAEEQAARVEREKRDKCPSHACDPKKNVAQDGGRNPDCAAKMLEGFVGPVHCGSCQIVLGTRGGKCTGIL